MCRHRPQLDKCIQAHTHTHILWPIKVWRYSSPFEFRVIYFEWCQRASHTKRGVSTINERRQHHLNPFMFGVVKLFNVRNVSHFDWAQMSRTTRTQFRVHKIIYISLLFVICKVLMMRPTYFTSRWCYVTKSRAKPETETDWVAECENWFVPTIGTEISLNIKWQMDKLSAREWRDRRGDVDKFHEKLDSGGVDVVHIVKLYAEHVQRVHGQWSRPHWIRRIRVWCGMQIFPRLWRVCAAV